MDLRFLIFDNFNFSKNVFMRKLSILSAAVLLIFIMESCLENDTKIRFTDYISVSAGLIEDTVVINTPITISLRASAPSTCWHSLTFKESVKNDTSLTYWAYATYEDNGSGCNPEMVEKDTVVTLTPTLLKPYVINLYSKGLLSRSDTIVVIANR